jgi:hypothetical protein
MKLLGKNIMIGCKESTMLSIKKLEQPLTFAEKIAYRIHTLLCGPCLFFAKQITKLHQSLKNLRKEDSVTFSDEKKKELEEIIKKNS